ncbi:MAG: DUF5624 domain-containing protein [Bacteroidota bacterium]
MSDSSQNETSGRGYVVPATVSSAYINVFHIFGAAAGKCIADQLTAADSSENAESPLLIVGGSEIVLFPTSTSDPIEIPFHGTGDEGFNELTAISHVGPAMGYFAEMKEKGLLVEEDDSDNPLATPKALKAALLQVQQENEDNGTDYWMNKLDATINPYYSIKTEKMRKMVAHACQLVIDYVDGYYDEAQPEYDFSFTSLHKYLFNDKDGKTGYNQVMVATFSLVIADGTLYLKQALDAQAIDWSKAIIMITGMAGGIGSGLNFGTNSTYVQLKAIAGADIVDQTMFVPYAQPGFDATVPAANYTEDSVAGTGLTPTEARFAAIKAMNTTYRGLYYNLVARRTVAQQMFDPSVPVLGQTYPSFQDAPATLDTLLSRMKTCMIDDRQLMSNCVADAIGNLLIEAEWDAEAVVLPCFDRIW